MAILKKIPNNIIIAIVIQSRQIAHYKLDIALGKDKFPSLV